jgi:hypothetical protein
MAEDMATISANKSAVLSVDLMEVSHKRRAMTFATTGQGQGDHTSFRRRAVSLAVQDLAV